MDGTMEQRVWRRACMGAPECVEVAVSARGAAMRDSKDPAGPVLEFTAAQWAAFTAEVRGGRFEAGA